MPKLMQAIQKIWDDAADANPFLKAFLILFSKPYEILMRIRAVLYSEGFPVSKRLPCKVISVGNITMGGTGKTPMIRYLARCLTENGRRVAIVSRGYKGGLETQGGIVSDGRTVLVDASEAGDEPFMLAKSLPNVPVVVGANRYRAGRQAVSEFSPEVILLDDAFQHLKLNRDIDLVLLDCARPFGNGYTLPAGELREPLQALRRADAIILTRSDSKNEPGQLQAAYEKLNGKITVPVFKARHAPIVKRIISGGRQGASENPTGGQGTELLKGQRVFAFSGVAKNDYFLYTLAGLKCRVAGSQQFPDHHKYSPADLQAIGRQARGLEVQYIVTTEKDFVKTGPDVVWPVSLVALDVEISFGSESEKIQSFLWQNLEL